MNIVLLSGGSGKRLWPSPMIPGPSSLLKYFGPIQVIMSRWYSGYTARFALWMQQPM